MRGRGSQPTMTLRSVSIMKQRNDGLKHKKIVKITLKTSKNGQSHDVQQYFIQNLVFTISINEYANKSRFLDVQTLFYQLLKIAQNQAKLSSTERRWGGLDH